MNLNKIIAIIGLYFTTSLSMNAFAEKEQMEQQVNRQDIIGKWNCRLNDEKLGTKISTLDQYSEDGNLISSGDVDVNFNATVVQYKITSKQKWTIGGDMLNWKNVDLLRFKTSDPKLEEVIKYRSSMEAGTTGSAKIVELSADKLVLQYLVDGVTEIAPTVCTR